MQSRHHTDGSRIQVWNLCDGPRRTPEQGKMPHRHTGSTKARWHNCALWHAVVKGAAGRRPGRHVACGSEGQKGRRAGGQEGRRCAWDRRSGNDRPPQVVIGCGMAMDVAGWQTADCQAYAPSRSIRPLVAGARRQAEQTSYINEARNQKRLN